MFWNDTYIRMVYDEQTLVKSNGRVSQAVLTAHLNEAKDKNRVKTGGYESI